VSGKFIDEFNMACSEEDRSQLKLMMGHVHVYVTAACKEYFDKLRRHVYVTPKSYLSFIQGYKELYSRKWAYTQELAASIQVSGLADTHVWFLMGLWAGGCTTDDDMPQQVAPPPPNTLCGSRFHHPLICMVSVLAGDLMRDGVLLLCPISCLTGWFAKDGGSQGGCEQDEG
jgi:hypothetical protein